MFYEMMYFQKDMMDKFDLIEGANGFPMNFTIGDLENPFTQARLRDFAWRITEETTEAIATLEDNKGGFHEEIVDIYHFLLELLLIVDIEPSHIFFSSTESLGCLFEKAEKEMNWFPQLQPDLELVKAQSMEFILTLGRAINLLKKRPWKLNLADRHTDIPQFKMWLALAHYEFIALAIVSGLTAESLYESYKRKMKINHERIAGAA